MPDVLAYSPSIVFEKFREQALARGLRLKHISSADLIPKLLDLRTFSGFLVDAELDISTIEQVVGQVQEANPMVLCWAYSPKEIKRAKEVALAKLALDITHDARTIEQYFDVLAPEQNPSSPHVLLLEDLDTPREIVAMYVENLGYRVTEASSAPEAFEILSANPMKFMCLITDLNMPEMNGLQLVQKLRADKRFDQLPVVVLSAYGTGTTVFDCLGAGVSGFLAKPPRKADLVRELGRARRVASGLQKATLIDSDDLEIARQALVERGLLL